MNRKIALIVISVLVGAGCVPEEQKKQEAPQVIPVRVEKVRARDLQKALEYTGNIKAQNEVLVYPKVSGKIIEKIKGDGMLVLKGETIAYIDRDEVGLIFERAPVESPLSGVIGRVYVDIGAHVLSTTPVALVVNMEKVQINLDIPEIYLPKVFLGQEATISVDAYPDEEFKGQVTKISPVVNLQNRAAPIEITIDNLDARLKSGMFAKVSLVVENRSNVPVILKEAIMGKMDNLYVYAVRDNKAFRRNILLGIHDGPFYEVTQGLQEGEMVVVVGQQRLYDNALVAVEMGNGNGQGVEQ